MATKHRKYQCFQLLQSARVASNLGALTSSRVTPDSLLPFVHPLLSQVGQKALEILSVSVSQLNRAGHTGDIRGQHLAGN